MKDTNGGTPLTPEQRLYLDWLERTWPRAEKIAYSDLSWLNQEPYEALPFAGWRPWPMRSHAPKSTAQLLKLMLIGIANCGALALLLAALFGLSTFVRFMMITHP